MSIGQREKATQKRVIKLFAQELGYTYLGDFTERKNSNIETELLTKFLIRKGCSPVLISRALKELQDAACFLQALFPQKCRLTSSKLHGEFPHYCISSSGTLSGAGEESLQAYKVY